VFQQKLNELFLKYSTQSNLVLGDEYIRRVSAELELDGGCWLDGRVLLVA